mgnify:CR=1 FL=1|tara:strand:+ start:9077 stop:9850 length:774 start_codon:yes stop_codon:yes gene_type:complete
MNEEQIVDLYVNECKSTYEIAQIFKTYPNKIRRVLIRNNVEMKNKSDAQKNALKQGKAKIPTLGKKRTMQEKLKISNGLTERWKNISEEEYQEYVTRGKENWKNKSLEDKEKMKELAIKQIRIASVEGSKLEKFIREFLISDYDVQYHYKLPSTELEVDLFLPELKTIIEVDGLSHFAPIWGETKLKQQIASDTKKSGIILAKGFTMIRIKHLSDHLSLARREFLKNELEKLLVKILNNVADYGKMKKKDRYIEIEL